MQQETRNWGKKLLSCLLAAGLLASASGCGQQVEEVVAQEKEILVNLQKPEVGSLTLSTEFIGTVEPDELVNVYPKVSGTVLRTNFNVGDPVKKGDVLFEIDPVDIQLSVNAAKAAVDTVQASMDQALGSSFDLQLAQLENSVKAAQNGYSTARTNLKDYNDDEDDMLDYYADKRDAAYANMKDLQLKLDDAKKQPNPDEKLIKELTAELTTAETQYSLYSADYRDYDDDDDPNRKNLRTSQRNAELSYETANKIFDITKDAVFRDTTKTYEAQLNQALASYESAARQLEYTRVVSPIDGVIEARSIVADANASPSNAAFTVSNKDIITVLFYVPADAVEQMTAGDRVTVENGQRAYEGAVTEIGAMVDPSTGLFKIKASVNVTDGTLLTGLSVKVNAITARAERKLLLPQALVYYDDGEAYVYVYDNGAAVKTPLTVGISNAETVEVLSGISESSQVISSWNPNLADGRKVTVSSDDAAASPAPEASSGAAESAAPESAPSASEAPQEG